jgi:hypothetical protein
MNSPDAWMAGGGHIIRAEIRNQIEESAEFKRHQEKLLELVDARDSAVGSSVPVELTTDWGRRLATRTMADLPELPADLQNRFETQKANAELALNVRDPLQKVLGQINLRHEVFFAYCDLARELVRES